MTRYFNIRSFAKFLRISLQASAPAFVSWATAIAVLSLPSSSLAKGRCYKAESLKGPYGEPGTKPIEPVCRALERNLNEFCDEPPMVCDLKIHPEHRAELALPKWTPVELDGSLKFLEDLIRAPWQSSLVYDAATTVWESERPDLEAALIADRLRVSSAPLDLYQTGLMAEVYRYDLGNCAQKNPHLTPTNINDAWDEQLTGPDIQNIPSPNDVRALEKRYQALGHLGLGGQVFLYRGKTFMYYMYGYHRPGTDPSLPPTNEVGVDQGINYLLNDKPTVFFRNVCQLSYKSKGANK